MDPVKGRSGAGEDPPAQAVLIDYLRSFGIAEPRELERLAAHLGRHLSPFDSTEACLARVRNEVGAWFQRALGFGPTPYEAEAMGRAAYILTGAAARWPGGFLSDAELPAPLLGCIRSAAPVGAWQTAPVRMPVQILETPTLAGLLRGLGEIADALRITRTA